MAKNTIQSVEPNIADLANGWLKSYKLDYKLEQESLNTEIDKALNDYFSKNGGAGGNRPDAKLLLQDKAYLATCVYKSLSHKYSWGDSVSKTKIKNDRISLPTKDGKPDFDIMQTFISAIQKLVIKDVVKYSEKKISATKLVTDD